MMSEINEGNEEIVEVAPAAESTEVQEEVVPEEYAPNYSYKYKDEDREFDERFRAGVTDKESEDYLRDLYTKADGLEGVKTKNSEWEEKYNTVYAHDQKQTVAFDTLRSLRSDGNFRQLFASIGVTEDQLIDHVAALIDEQNLPEDQQQVLKTNRDMEQKMAKLQSSVDSMSNNNQQANIQRDVNELTSLSASESYQPIVKAMEGFGLNFNQEVYNTGRAHYESTGKELSVDEVATHVREKYSKLINNAVANDGNVIPEQKKVLPVVKGGGNTSTGTQIMSIDDIRKIHSSMVRAN